MQTVSCDRGEHGVGEMTFVDIKRGEEDCFKHTRVLTLFTGRIGSANSMVLHCCSVKGFNAE